jgi:predicted dehydrogenase
MLKVAIIGCGKIADSHAAQIKRVEGCEIVAACDREELMARQLCERFQIKDAFTDVQTMLAKAQPNVVHITTPPQSHYELAKLCLDNGSHVYVEKPFTLNTMEAVDLIEHADNKKLKITAGHDDQFRHSARRMRELAKNGYLGSGPVHMESYYCYELAKTSSYARAILADKGHWVRRLPGGLLHNIISHGIARIAEFLTTDSPEVIAYGFPSPALRSMGEDEIIDELRVIISEAESVTAYFTFSSQMRPSLHQFRIYGSRNGMILDQDNETLVKLRGARRKSFLEQFVSPFDLAREYAGNSLRNIKSFLANDFHPKAGMKFLIESFYRSIHQGTPPPIPYREIILTSRIMDEIFSQLRTARAENGAASANLQRQSAGVM